MLVSFQLLQQISEISHLEKSKGLLWLTLLGDPVYGQLANALGPMVKQYVMVGSQGGTSSSPHGGQKVKREWKRLAPNNPFKDTPPMT